MALAKRITNLDWATALTDNLPTGLHPFAIGYVMEEEAEAQREHNREADMLAAGTEAATLSDTQAILSSTATVHIPTRPAHAKVTHQRAHLMWVVLLGGDHPFTARCKLQVDEFVARKSELKRARPRNPKHQYLTSALITRRTQLDTNYWLRRQACTDEIVPAPDLTEVFREIAELDKDWAPTFPARYLQEPPKASGPDSTPPGSVNPSNQSSV